VTDMAVYLRSENKDVCPMNGEPLWISKTPFGDKNQWNALRLHPCEGLDRYSPDCEFKGMRWCKKNREFTVQCSFKVSHSPDQEREG